MTGADAGDQEALEDLPPSAKFVHYLLEERGEQTQAALAEESGMSSRTVRYALERLDDIDLIESRTYLRDARKDLYSLVGEAEAPEIRPDGGQITREEGTYMCVAFEGDRLCEHEAVGRFVTDEHPPGTAVTSDLCERHAPDRTPLRALNGGDDRVE